MVEKRIRSLFVDLRDLVIDCGQRDLYRVPCSKFEERGLLVNKQARDR